MSRLPPLSQELQHRVSRRVNECLQRLREAGLLPAGSADPELRFDLRGLAAGQADSRGVLRFNPHYLLAETEHFLHHTVAHEVAHYADFLRRGRSDHGRQWRRLMHQLEVPATRTHPYRLPLSRVSRLQTFVYRCDCQQLELTSIRHRRQQRALKEHSGPLYFCTRCRQALVFQAAAQ